MDSPPVLPVCTRHVQRMSASRREMAANAAGRQRSQKETRRTDSNFRRQAARKLGLPGLKTTQAVCFRREPFLRFPAGPVTTPHSLCSFPNARPPRHSERALSQTKYNMSLIPSHVQAAHAYAGRALSAHERIAFENAAQQTHIDEKLALVPAFWGKIEVWGGQRLVAEKGRK
jgi:hypothetical protein